MSAVAGKPQESANSHLLPEFSGLHYWSNCLDFLAFYTAMNVESFGRVNLQKLARVQVKPARV